jgi:SAM-dependent methyltransferase
MGEGNPTIADIGAGDMYFSKMLADMGNCTVYAIDHMYQLSERADNLITYNNIECLEDNSIDIVVMMDVLEHVEDVDSFLQVLQRKTKENAIFLITVPAWQHLYCHHDKFTEHFCRYDKKQLNGELKRNNLSVQKIFYFFFPLYLLRTFQVYVLWGKDREPKASATSRWKYGRSHIVTKLVYSLLKIDFLFNKTFSFLPGLSLFALCRKKTLK